MNEKNSADPPSYSPHQGQSNAAFQPAPSSYGTNYNAPLTGGYSQQPAFPERAQAYSNVVYHQQPPPVSNVVMTSVDDNMGMAIFATLCCFWPLGIVAILRASEVRSALAVGDYPRAQRLSEESRRMSRYAIVIGAILIVFIFIVVLAVNLSAAA